MRADAALIILGEAKLQSRAREWFNVMAGVHRPDWHHRTNPCILHYVLTSQGALGRGTVVT